MDNWYKRWMYHEKLLPQGKIIHTPEQLAALGPGWVDTPGKFGTVPLEDPPPPAAPPEPVMVPEPERPSLTINLMPKTVSEVLDRTRPRKNK
jgi:hypothetical protein